MNFKEIKQKTTKEELKKQFNISFLENNNNPRLMRVSMSEALNVLNITNTTRKVSTTTIEALSNWIDA